MINAEEFYNERVRNYGPNSKTVGWRDETQQNHRFEVLLDGLNLADAKVLDIGCGLGDLVNFLRNKNINIDSYLGIDVSGEMIKLAKELHPDMKYDFVHTPFSDFWFSTKFDYMVMSGALNLRNDLGDYDRIKDFFSFAKNFLTPTGFVCANFLSDEVDYMQVHHQHYNAQSTVDFLKEEWSNVRLIEDYGLYEFTIQAQQKVG